MRGFRYLNGIDFGDLNEIDIPGKEQLNQCSIFEFSLFRISQLYSILRDYILQSILYSL